MVKLIEINENWSVDTDGDKNVILMKKVEKRVRNKEKKTWENTGEYDWSVYGYYPNLESLLKAVVRKEITGEGLKDIESIQEKIEELEKVIKKTVKKYYKEEQMVRKIDRTGEERLNNFGSKMVITGYRNKRDIDVCFPEYNWLFKHATYQNFKTVK